MPIHYYDGELFVELNRNSKHPIYNGLVSYYRLWAMHRADWSPYACDCDLFDYFCKYVTSNGYPYFTAVFGRLKPNEQLQYKLLQGAIAKARKEGV